MISSAQSDFYFSYLESRYAGLDEMVQAKIYATVAATSWETPQTSFDWNNVGVLYLVEAEQADEPWLRQFSLEAALEAFDRGMQLERISLCAVHRAALYRLLGESDRATEAAFSTFMLSLLTPSGESSEALTGLVYLPPTPSSLQQSRLELILSAAPAMQLRLLLAEILSSINPVFYSVPGMRMLAVAENLQPDAAHIRLKLGLAQIVNGQWEGLLHLHRAVELAPKSAPALQALQLAYRTLGHENTVPAELAGLPEEERQNPEWQWAQQPAGSPFTCVPFDGGLLVVEASLKSIVTSVLLAEGDWFEAEMELWRHWIQPGMTVIDVGANVGIYTFSAAARVGTQGRVLAIEPFSQCVRCLEETIKRNQLTQVTVYAAAASDEDGTARLRLQSASELNELVSEETAQSLPPGSCEEVERFTLDSLCQREQLERVDFLKIDAEGHELAVLQGSKQLLENFAPVVLYENIAANSGSNLEVAMHFKMLGYSLFRYRPFLGQLVPIESTKDLDGQLNIIAIPASKVSMFVAESEGTRTQR